MQAENSKCKGLEVAMCSMCLMMAAGERDRGAVGEVDQVFGFYSILF